MQTMHLRHPILWLRYKAYVLLRDAIRAKKNSQVADIVRRGEGDPILNFLKYLLAHLIIFILNKKDVYFNNFALLDIQKIVIKITVSLNKLNFDKS